MGCQNCGSSGSCACAVSAGDGTIEVTGNGSADQPYAITTQVSQAAGNTLIKLADGLHVPVGTGGGVPVYPTATRPIGSVGLTYYDTTIPGILAYASPTAGYQKPWNLPWGHFYTGSGSSPNAQTGTIGTVTHSLLANRRILIQGWVQVASADTSGQTINIKVQQAGLDKISVSTTPTTNAVGQVSRDDIPVLVETTTTGVSTTFQMVFSISANTMTVERYYWVFQDIGPSGPPV